VSSARGGLEAGESSGKIKQWRRVRKLVSRKGWKGKGKGGEKEEVGLEKRGREGGYRRQQPESTVGWG